MKKREIEQVMMLPSIDIDTQYMPPRRIMARDVKPHPALEALVKHPRNERIAFSRDEGCFRVNMQATGNGTRYTGLTNALRTHFWPDFDLDSARKNATRNKARDRELRRKRRRQQSMSWKVRKRIIETGTRKHGVELGSLVHQQLEDYANLSRHAFLEKHRDGVNAYTVKIALLLHAMKLKPVIAEVPVFCERSHVATKIDMVCTRIDTGLPVLVEIKTSYQGYFSKFNGAYMQTPLSAWPSHPLNHARVQVIMARLFLKHRYGIKNFDALVVHCYRDGVQAHCIPRQWFAMEDALYSTLVRKRLAKRNRSRGGKPLSIPSQGRRRVYSRNQRPSRALENYQYRGDSRKRKFQYVIL